MGQYFLLLNIGKTFRVLYPASRGLPAGWLTKISKQVAVTQDGVRVRITKNHEVQTLPPRD